MSNALKTKECTECERSLPATSEYFHRNKQSPDGLRNNCKECQGTSFGSRPSLEASTDVPNDESSIECPTCGNSFKSEQGVGIHHAKIHDEPLRVSLNCDNCGGDLERMRCNVHDTNFCDEDCQYEYQTGENNPCANSVKTECGNCGEPLTIPRSVYNENGANFCNHTGCYAEYRAQFYVGPNHPRWLGGNSPYGSEWSETLKEHIRERQSRCCAGCGVHESEYPRKLDVHHIQKARSIDNPVERSDDANLVALCRSCHMKWEQMSPLRPQVVE